MDTNLLIFFRYSFIKALEGRTNITLFISFLNSLKNIELTIIDDLGINFKLHEGIYINNSIPGKEVLNYLTMIKQFISKSLESYTDIASILTNDNLDFKNNYIKLVDKYIIGPILINASD